MSAVFPTLLIIGLVYTSFWLGTKRYPAAQIVTAVSAGWMIGEVFLK